MRLKNSCNSFLPRNDYGLAIRWGSQKTGVAKNRGRKTTFFSKDSIANIAIGILCLVLRFLSSHIVQRITCNRSFFTGKDLGTFYCPHHPATKAPQCNGIVR